MHFLKPTISLLPLTIDHCHSKRLPLCCIPYKQTHEEDIVMQTFELSDGMVGSCKVPPENPRKSPPKRKVVFVNPEESNVYWWPAMVVPRDEYLLFSLCIEDPDVPADAEALAARKAAAAKTSSDKLTQADLKFELPKPGEVLVTYFEDGSYNMVKEKDLKQFCPYQVPYVDYCKGSMRKQFCKDKAVQLATLYWETGRVPTSFTWLHGLPKEDRTHIAKLNSGHAASASSASSASSDDKANGAQNSGPSHRKGKSSMSSTASLGNAGGSNSTAASRKKSSASGILT